MKKSILLLSLAIITINCQKKEGENKDTVAITAKPENILNAGIAEKIDFETTELKLKPITSTLILNGKIDVPPQNLISVSAPMGGYLKSTSLIAGKHIRKGEILATIEDQQYIQLQNDFLLAKSKLTQAIQELNRQNDLFKNQAGSEKSAQAAQFEVNNLTISVNSLSEKLKLININSNQLTPESIRSTVHIYSKISGYVSKVNVNIGKYVSPTEVLFELIDPQDIHLNLKVFEKDISKLYIGQKVLAYSNMEPNKKYNCEIILISQDINNEGFTEVHCHFEQYSKILLPGMYMNAQLPLNEINAYTINEDAVVNFEGKNYLFVQNSNKEIEMIEAKIGTKYEGDLEIKNAQAFNAKKVVSKGAYTFLMALKNKEEE